MSYNLVKSSRSIKKIADNEVKDVSVQMSDDIYETAYVPIREWYLARGVYRGKKYSERQLCTHLGIKRSTFDGCLLEVKSSCLIDLSDLGRVKYFQNQIGVVEKEISELARKIEILLHPLMEAVAENSTNLKFFETEAASFLMANVTKLISQRDAAISRKMEVIKMVFGNQSNANRLYETMNEISGSNNYLTKDTLIEVLDENRKFIGTPTKVGQLGMSYEEYEARADIEGEEDEFDKE